MKLFGCDHLFMINFENSNEKYTTLECVTCGKSKKVKTSSL